MTDSLWVGPRNRHVFEHSTDDIHMQGGSGVTRTGLGCMNYYPDITDDVIPVLLRIKHEWKVKGKDP